MYLALTNDPHSTTSWVTGSSGERRLGGYLDSLNNDASLIVLHDRRIARTRANIDHVAITSGGIFVIDAKNYRGKVQKIDKGGWFSTDLRLCVGRRDCSKLISGTTKQVEAVRQALGEPVMQEFAVTITPVLCFVEAEWSLFARPFQLKGVRIDWPNSLGERLRAPGPLARRARANARAQSRRSSPEGLKPRPWERAAPCQTATRSRGSSTPSAGRAPARPAVTPS